jgi:hypothetical protein
MFENFGFGGQRDYRVEYQEKRKKQTEAHEQEWANKTGRLERIGFGNAEMVLGDGLRAGEYYNTGSMVVLKLHEGAVLSHTIDAYQDSPSVERSLQDMEFHPQRPTEQHIEREHEAVQRERTEKTIRRREEEVVRERKADLLAPDEKPRNNFPQWG